MPVSVSKKVAAAVIGAFAFVAFVGMTLAAQERGASAQSGQSLQGAWELIEARYNPPDPKSNLAEFRQVKILTGTHWAFLAQKRSPRKLPKSPKDAELLEAARVFGAGGGTYTLTGDTYAEHIEFFSTPNFVGVTIPWKLKWQGDEWIMTGTLPMKSLGLADQDVQLYERYRRVK
jgi:hypothetical protein